MGAAAEVPLAESAGMGNAEVAPVDVRAVVRDVLTSGSKDSLSEELVTSVVAVW